jgi:hypothetical protein
MTTQYRGDEFHTVLVVRGLGVAAAGVLFLSGGSALGQVTSSDPIIQIHATSGSLSGWFNVPLSSASPDGNGGFTWASPPSWSTFPQQILDSSTSDVVGSIKTLSLNVTSQFRVGLSFNVIAGSAGTHFDVFSAMISFPTVAAADAFASASAAIGVTDGDGNGVTLAGAQAGGFVYKAMYNSVPGPAATFSSLVSGGLNTGVSFGSTDSANTPATGPTRFPLSGRSAVGSAVSDMTASFAFDLSANDLANGTSTFVLVPGPGAVALLGAGGFVMLRRRR